MVLAMLDALDVHDGQQVLEIGTGTGYSAALLAHRLGEQQVTSIEVDPVLTAQARNSLQAAGYHPTVVCADGVAGWPDTAPYDRVICTAAVIAGRLPYSWVQQTRPGGLILTPWGTAYCNGALLLLTVHDDHTATGRFVGNAAFMRLRTQRTPFGHVGRLGDLVDASAVESVTDLSPDQAATGEGGFSVGLHLNPTCSAVFTTTMPSTTKCCSTTWPPTRRPPSRLLRSPPRRDAIRSASTDPARCGTKPGAPTAGGQTWADRPVPATA